MVGEVTHIVNESLSIIIITKEELSENRQDLHKIIGGFKITGYKVRKYYINIGRRSISGWPVCTALYTVRMYYTGSKKNHMAGFFSGT